MAVDSKAMSLLEIPGHRDGAVKEYGEWQASNVTDDTLKAASRQACDVMLENGLDLEQVYRDQDPEIYHRQGNKNGNRDTFRRGYSGLDREGEERNLGNAHL